MNIVQVNAYFTNSDDTEYGEPMVETAFVINSTLALSIYGDCYYVFREITGWDSEGRPIIDLATAKHFELIMQQVPRGIDVKWLLGANVLEIAQQFLTSEQTLKGFLCSYNLDY